jgi:hypothetical protein
MFKIGAATGESIKGLGAFWYSFGLTSVYHLGFSVEEVEAE